MTTETDVLTYIELFYNRQRKHSALAYSSPVNFEQSDKAELETAD